VILYALVVHNILIGCFLFSTYVCFLKPPVL